MSAFCYTTLLLYDCFWAKINVQFILHNTNRIIEIFCACVKICQQGGIYAVNNFIRNETKFVIYVYINIFFFIGDIELYFSLFFKFVCVCVCVQFRFG